MNVRCWFYRKYDDIYSPCGQGMIGVPLEKAEGSNIKYMRNQSRARVNMLDFIRDFNYDLSVTDNMPDYFLAPVIVER